jgi:two-component system chemotaxis response regulator CheB
MPHPRVLVVDDSAFARTVLARVLRASGSIDVIGTARDGDDALAQIAASDPDVITLDLTMPGKNGLDVLRALQGKSRPRVLVVSVSTIDSVPGVEALALGALDVISKPTALASDRLYELGNELVIKVLAATEVHHVNPLITQAVAPAVHGEVDLVMIGTSTGGPQALTRVLAALPADLDAAVAVVLHIPIGYTEALAQRLDKSSPLEVVEAHEGIELRRGRVVIARAGVHLKVQRRGDKLIGHLDPLPIRSHTPAVDELFKSGVEAVGARCLGVVLTGMGDDGLAGARAISTAGGALLTEAASTSVVYGMPRVVFEAGIGARQVPLDNIPNEIISHVSTHR